MDQNSAVSIRPNVTPRDDIADLLLGVCGPGKAIRMAWDLTEPSGSSELQLLANEKKWDDVIYAIVWLVGSPKFERSGRFLRTCLWVINTEHGDGCEVIVIERTVRGAPEMSSLVMRRRRPTDPPEWFTTG